MTEASTETPQVGDTVRFFHLPTISLREGVVTADRGTMYRYRYRIHDEQFPDMPWPARLDELSIVRRKGEQ